jgi:hypothetical protein
MEELKLTTLSNNAGTKELGNTSLNMYKKNSKSIETVVNSWHLIYKNDKCYFSCNGALCYKIF